MERKTQNTSIFNKYCPTLQLVHFSADAVKAKNGCVFVHCHAGISRSATICIAYIMKTMQLDLSKAYEFVKQKRPCISPNLHFMGQLLEFQKQLQLSIDGEPQSCAEDMVDNDLDTPVPSASTNCLYFDVSLREYSSPLMEGECFMHTTALPSASAPSSLNFEKENSNRRTVKQSEFDNSIQVLAAPRSLKKPNTLPLTSSVKKPRFQTSLSVQPMDWAVDRIAKGKRNSSSLPTTPTPAVWCHKNILPALSPLGLSHLPRVPHPLLHSPCRVAARSESCLNHYPHTSLAESM